MRRLLALSFLATLAACGVPEPPDDDPCAGAPDATPILFDVQPEPGDAEFFAGNVLFVEFDRAPEGVELSLVGPEGAVAAQQTTGGNGQVEFLIPDADLQPLTAYTFAIDWSPRGPCTEPVAIEFATSAHGLPVESPDKLPATTFALDLAGATFVEPPGIGPIIQSQLGDVAVLLRPLETSALDEGELHVLGGLGTESAGAIAQDLCSETLPVTYGPDGQHGTADDAPALWTDPHLLIGPTDFDLAVDGLAVTLFDLEIAGTFHPGLDDLKGGTFAGELDTRPLAELLEPGAGPNAVCELVEETLGIPCSACPGSGEPFCLRVAAEDVEAAPIEAHLVERTAADVAADPACVE